MATAHAGSHPPGIGEIVRGTRGTTAATALRPSRALGDSERFWMNLPGRYDLDREHEAHGAERADPGPSPGADRSPGPRWRSPQSGSTGEV